jgi:hypothetical protein
MAVAGESGTLEGVADADVGADEGAGRADTG